VKDHVSFTRDRFCAVKKSVRSRNRSRDVPPTAKSTAGGPTSAILIQVDQPTEPDAPPTDLRYAFTRPEVPLPPSCVTARQRTSASHAVRAAEIVILRGVDTSSPAPMNPCCHSYLYLMSGACNEVRSSPSASGAGTYPIPALEGAR